MNATGEKKPDHTWNMSPCIRDQPIDRCIDHGHRRCDTPSWLLSYRLFQDHLCRRPSCSMCPRDHELLRVLGLLQGWLLHATRDACASLFPLRAHSGSIR